MKNIFFTGMILLIASGSFFCKSPSKTTNETTPADTHNSQTSLDWDGIYQGVILCADCDGIQKTVYLNKDGSYKLKVKYLGKQDKDSIMEYSGKFSWNDKGNTITLNDIGAQPVSYIVGENILTQL